MLCKDVGGFEVLRVHVMVVAQAGSKNNVMERSCHVLQRVKPPNVDEMRWRQALAQAGGPNNPDR